MATYGFPNARGIRVATLAARNAHVSYAAWREQEHDDLVLAVALACWWGERGHARVWFL